MGLTSLFAEEAPTPFWLQVQRRAPEFASAPRTHLAHVVAEAGTLRDVMAVPLRLQAAGAVGPLS